MAGHTIVYTPIQGKIREEYFNDIIYIGTMPTLTGNKHASIHLSCRRPRPFRFPREKFTGQLR